MVRIPQHRPPTHPGEMLLEEFLKPLGLTQTETAKRLGISLRRLNELIVGRRSMTPDTALRLEALLGASAAFWLNLQVARDLYEAQHSANAPAIRKIRRAVALAR
jgi:addiction module HigA family antidote